VVVTAATRYRRGAAALLAAAVALGAGGACSPGDDSGGEGDGEGAFGESTDREATTTSPSDGDAGSDLTIDGRDAASDVEREMSETLSSLDVEARGGDTVVTLPEHVLFAFGEHELLPEATQVLDDLAAVIAEVEGAAVQVNGHTDAVGSTEANQQLSERRAQAVVDHLVAAGVEADRLQPAGFGESQPVAPNARADGSDDPDGRARNRRVEVVIEGVDLSGGG
jgi:outer membrane protein OmpA-like peptidoglycan-associated protein